MELFVMAIIGKIVTLFVTIGHATDSIEVLMLFTKGIPCDQQRMICGGKQLEEDE